uniref:MULE transposase domain-containing protein n=1 Tax=Panagrolaimus superbus TaxID=310955 RepID=A0A914Z0W1_9BILA
MLVPHFAKTSFADLELLVQEILTDEPDVFDVKYILNETNPQKSDFIIIFSCLSLMLKQRAQKHACVDGTWKLVHNNFVVLVFGFVDLNNHVHVTGVGIASSETTNVFKWIFEFFKSNRFTEGSWSPTEIMADNSRAISAAVLIVFPQAKRRNCYAHVIRACDTKMQELHFSADLRETTLSQIRELSRCPTETYFDLAAEALITEWSSAEYQSHKDFAIYFQRQYVELDKNWFAENGAGCRTDF